MLAQASQNEQKQMLGERLYPMIHGMHGDLSGKITGMLLEIDNAELLHMLESRDSLIAKVIILKRCQTFITVFGGGSMGKNSTSMPIII